MKKNYLWTMAALFVSGLVLTSCEMQDNPNPKPVSPLKLEVAYLDFEEGEVADYFGLVKAESQLVEPTADGSTGRAAAIVSGSDRGDYVMTNADLEGAMSYSVDLDLLPNKSPKATQFAVITQSTWEGWDTWMSNWGIFWKDNKTQEHTGILFSFEFNNSDTADIMVDIDADGNAVKAEEQWMYEDNVWYHLSLNVDVATRTVNYLLTKNSDGSTQVSGTYIVPVEDSILLKGIYWRNGRLNSGTGAIAIDNVKVVGLF